MNQPTVEAAALPGAADKLFMMKHALAYARAGIPVLPTWWIKADGRCACDDPQCGVVDSKQNNPGKHPIPKHGFKHATCDASIIRHWWKANPLAGIAGVPGLIRPHAMVVFDLDSEAAAADLAAEHGPFSRTVVCRTARGWHVYYLAADGARFPAKLAPQVDVRHDRGYVMLPPTLHRSGVRYSWLEGCSILDDDARDWLCYAPEWTHADQLHKRSEGPPAIEDPLARGYIEEPDTPEHRARLLSALRAIDPDEPGQRNRYLEVLWGVKTTGWPDAEDIARQWASGALHDITAALYSEADFDRDYRGTKRPAGLITLGSVFHHAKQAGWIDQRTTAVAETFGDLSNGKRFAEKHRGRFLHVHAAKKWLTWDGKRWAWCEAGEPLRAAGEIAGEALDTAHKELRADTNERTKSNHAHALAVHRNVKRHEAMLTLAAVEPGMSIANPGLLDADPWLLGVRNGVANLRTGTLLACEPKMLISRQAGAAFDKDATCPHWLAFLGAVFLEDADTIAFVQRAVGYSLTGLVDEEIAFFLLGVGANGKSVFANVLNEVFGEYAVVVRSTMLARDAKGNSSEAEREKARLPGARLALINEVGQGDVFDDRHVKELVSRERIGGRLLYGESFDFMPTHTIWIRGNHEPGVLDAGDAFWRRLALIRFPRQFGESERVPDLDRQLLAAERDGILAWAVEGCIAWQRDGLKMPAKVRAARDQYRRDSDQLGEWLDTCCIAEDPSVRTATSELFESYRAFLRSGGMNAPSLPSFGRQMAQRGFTVARTKKARLIEGIALRTPWASETDPLTER